MSSLWIINKAGGLVFQCERFAYPHRENGEPELSSNDFLILAGTLHGIHAIATRINPTPCKENTGIEVIEADDLAVHIKTTETGTKFVLLTHPALPNPQAILKRAYELYVDHVMKNPFYIAEMPIRVEDFDREINQLLK